MKNLLLGILLVTAFQVSVIASTGGQDFPDACHAAFLANPDNGNPMLFHFTDKSTGQINHWQWSFGDGATSTLQNPAHTYTAGGTYFVCLTVSDSDPGSICHDMICLPVTVHEPGTCVADYIYRIDSLNHLLSVFTDKSTGHINSWHWDFGDGTSSSEQNPHHLFPAAGKYRVCLSAYNSDSISVCNDIKCDSVTILEAEACHAGFTFELDSLNHASNTFRFNDTSAGNPNHYHWTIDNSTTFSTRNITYQFQVEGDHQVCLKISREVQGGTICSDSVCRVVKTAKYFNLGGHLFAGTFPINNPVSTGDTGVAYVFRKEGSRLIPYDTAKFTSLGYYAFPKLLNGSYLLQAMLTPGSAHYADYFPSYYSQALKWSEAIPLNMTDSNAFAAHTYLVPNNLSISGQGMIRGKIMTAGMPEGTPGLPLAEVILFNGQMEPARFAVSEQSGKYLFQNLSYGAYYLYAEVPGKYSRLTAIWLDAVRPVADSMKVEVFDYNVTGIAEDASRPAAGQLFPNPSTSAVNLVFHATSSSPVNYEIRTMNGLLAGSGQVSAHEGTNLLTFTVNQLPPGIYLFILHPAGGSEQVIRKLIKYPLK